MVKHVVKRDGRVVIFDKRKIVDAVLKAMDVTEEGEDIVLAAEIASAVSKIDVDNMSVEDIQDHVEMELMNSPRKEVAKKYIAYRNQRNLARKAKSREIFQEIIDAQATEITRENANMNADTPAGMMMKFASETSKPFVMDITCTALLMVFKDSSSASVGCADVYVDGEKVLTYDPHQVGWTHCNPVIIFRGKECKNYHVEVRMCAGDEKKDFTILGFGYVE